MKNNILNSLALYFVLGLLFFNCKPVYHVADINNDRYEIEQHELLPEDETINDIIKPYKDQLEVKMNRVIGTNGEKMHKARPEGELGNWVADIIYNEAAKVYDGKLDFAVQNHGGLRIPMLDKGPITVRDIYEIMPFDNEIVVIEAQGVVVKKLFERIAEKGGWPVSKQLQIRANNKYQIQSILINSEPFDITKKYTFALPDYIANGGDKCDFLENQDQIKFNLLVRDAIINYLDNTEKGAIQNVTREGRIKFSKN